MPEGCQGHWPISTTRQEAPVEGFPRTKCYHYYVGYRPLPLPYHYRYHWSTQTNGNKYSAQDHVWTYWVREGGGKHGWATAHRKSPLNVL